MKAQEKKLLSFTEVRHHQQISPLRQSEVPTEHSVSLPVPTNRFGEPCYAFFASPALRRPGQPTEQGPPDRWWAVKATGGGLVVYARSSAFKFSEDTWTSATLPPVTRSIEELRQQLKRIEELMNALVPSFLASENAAVELRRDLAAALEDALPAPILPQYRALAPDFFSWLES